MAEVTLFEHDDSIGIRKISGSALKTIYLDVNSNGKVWIDAYGDKSDPTGQYLYTTYGWLEADEAEQIALALLVAVKRAREKKAGK